MITFINLTSLNILNGSRLQGQFSKVIIHTYVNNLLFSHVEPVKPAGHTQLPYSMLKTPPFPQLVFEDANGKINCHETLNDSLDTTEITQS